MARHPALPLLLPPLLTLLLLWTAARCDTLTEPLTQDGQDGSLGGHPDDQLLSEVTRLSDRLTQVQTQLAQLTAGVNNTQNGLDVQRAVIAILGAQVGTQGANLEHRLAEIESLLEKAESQRAPPFARDCSDLPADSASRIYGLKPGQNSCQSPVLARCDMTKDGGGWTVIQRRADIQPREDFFRDWEAYRRGFGNLDGEFWWGLEHLFQVTSLNGRRYQLHVYVEDFEGAERYALYQSFRISSEADGYRIHIANYSGNAGDGLLKGHVGSRFSTKDRDQDSAKGHCAEDFKGGWWYNSCHDSNLNGLYLSGEYDNAGIGVDWSPFRGNKYSLKESIMKIRPV